ncbi:hypothetical protein BH10ACT6_BH10ACT6_15080 [soil metagenome]
MGGAITRVAATAPAAAPYGAFSYNTADWNGSTIKTWTAWMNEVATANAAPSWSQGLTSSPGCVMAPWGSSVNGPNATITGNTVIDARQATSGCAGVTLQQMTVKLDVTAPGRLTGNGTSSLGGNVNAGCFSSSGTVTIGHD